MKGEISRARGLRRNQTEAEKRLWWRLRNRQPGGHKFRRQVQVGKFIVDFLCEDSRLIVEVDGGQHAMQTEQDNARTKELENSGYLVMRFWNNEVLENTEGVLERILNTLDY